MREELKDVANRIVSNIKKEDTTYLNTRDIDISPDKLIVLGFTERVCVDGEINNGYVMMGKFECGNIDDIIYFYDGLVLFDTSGRDNIGDKIPIEDCYMETHTWWRTPTDDEIILYENIYKCNFVNSIDYIINKIDDIDKEEINRLLKILKTKAENML